MGPTRTELDVEQKIATPTKVSLVVMVACAMVTAVAFVLAMLARATAS
jgi:hypothetical protein